MDMKKACLVALLAFVCINMAMAGKPDHPPTTKGGPADHGAAAPAAHGNDHGAASATTPTGDGSHSESTLAHSPHNGSPTVFPDVSTLFGASVLSLLAFYAQ